MVDCGLSCLAWTAGIILGIYLLFQYFKKNIFAAFCSNMAKGPLFRKEKGDLFSRLNAQAKKVGPNKLKVIFSNEILTSSQLLTILIIHKFGRKTFWVWVEIKKRERYSCFFNIVQNFIVNKHLMMMMRLYWFRADPILLSSLKIVIVETTWAMCNVG